MGDSQPSCESFSAATGLCSEVDGLRKHRRRGTLLLVHRPSPTPLPLPSPLPRLARTPPDSSIQPLTSLNAPQNLSCVVDSDCVLELDDGEEYDGFLSRFNTGFYLIALCWFLGSLALGLAASALRRYSWTCGGRPLPLPAMALCPRNVTDG